MLRHPTQKLKARYILSLVVLGVLAIGNFILMESVVESQKSGALEINMAGRQRMLSQRISLLSFQLHALENKQHKAKIVEELTQAIELMKVSHTYLSQGNALLDMQPPASEKLKALYFSPRSGVDEKILSYLTLAEEHLQAVLKGERWEHVWPRYGNVELTELQGKLDEVVHQYQLENEITVAQLHKYEWYTFILTLCALTGIGLLVFRPVLAWLDAYITQLGNAEERFRKLAEVSSDWVWEMDEQLRFTHISESVARLSGYQPSFFIGKKREDITSSEELSKPHWQAHLNDMLERREFRDYEYEVTPPNAAKYFVRISGSPIFDDKGHFRGYRGTGADITDRVSTQLALVEAREAADRANKAKSDFLSSMSHELRTPMNAIIGFGQMLCFNPKEPLSKAQSDCVDHILKGGQHLLNLINDILDLSKIEAGQVELSIDNVSATEALYESLPLIKSMSEQRDIQISVPDEAQDVPKVRADHTRLKQVLLNLMSNAVKYNRDHGSIRVEITTVASDMLLISVTDTGEGIPEAQQTELFQPFNRLGAESTEIEGSGIGLVVCKDLVEMMGGEIGMSSEVGQGSTFWIKLPVAQNVPAEDVASIKKATAQAKVKLPDVAATLLYVEDNPANLRLMELIVSHVDGLTMISAHSGELGIELARAERPDIIILDINLPGLNGIEVLKKLGKHESTKNIPTLALSAAATQRDIEKGLEAGFLRYLTKPIQVLEIIDAIQVALDR